MSVSITGTLVQILPTVEGDSTRGHWIRGSFVIQYGDEYPRKALFTLFGEDKVRSVQAIPIGTPVQVRFYPESREYNGRYFTENRCLALYAVAPSYPTNPMPPTAPAVQPPSAAQPVQPAQPSLFPQPSPSPQYSPSADEDLPF